MIVIKIGGAEGVSLDNICADAARLVSAGEQILFVHGGSAETNRVAEQLGYPPRFVTSPSGYTSRYTDRKTLEIFAMATNGYLNTLIVETLQGKGINAFGMSGLDGQLMRAQRKSTVRIVEDGRQRILRDDFTGKIGEINTGLLNMLLSNGFTPVIAPLALSMDAEALNVDADRAAAMIAGTMGAKALILLTNVPGLMKKFPDENTLIHNLPYSGLENALSFAQGRMKKKVLGASEAIGMGVPRVIFADGRTEEPVQKAMRGEGTVIS